MHIRDYEEFSAYMQTVAGQQELENLTARVEVQDPMSLGLLGLNAFCVAGAWVVPDSLPGGYTVFSDPFAASVNLAAQHIRCRFETK